MKKLIVVFAMLFFAASLMACGPGQVVTIGLNDPDSLPWNIGVGGNFVYEVSTFEVQRFFNIRNDDNEIERELENIPSLSTMTFRLRQGHSLYFPNALNFALDGTRPAVRRYDAHTLLQMELRVAYCYDIGVSEIVYSYAVFDSANMAAVFSWRRAQMSALVQAGEFVYGDSSHQMWIDYRGNYSNAFIIYYPAPNETSYNSRPIPAAGDLAHLCNEYLFFLLRALNSTNTGGSQAIDFFNPMNALKNDRRINPVTINQETASSIVPLPFGGVPTNLVQSHFNIPSSSINQEGFWDNPRMARRTNLRLDTTRSGPDISLYFSAYPVRPSLYMYIGAPRFALTQVLMQIVTNTYGFRGGSFDTGTPLYTTVFSLVHYWNGVV